MQVEESQSNLKSRKMLVVQLSQIWRRFLEIHSGNMEFILANYDARDKFAISSDGTIYTLKPLDRKENPR